MSDLGFPLIEYPPGLSHRKWGQIHGESLRDGIRELASIRMGLMRNRNPKWTEETLLERAKEQWKSTLKAAPKLTEELEGIRDGAGISKMELVVVNNYTDFRDINPSGEGCSTIFTEDEGFRLAGQTWDMHRSAKDYVAALKIPQIENFPAVCLFTLAGCVGMAGFNGNGVSVGVNNINTTGARPGVIWPVFVRMMLECRSHSELLSVAMNTELTSGHSYMLISDEKAQMWEMSPEVREKVSEIKSGEGGTFFHTNHCLGKEMKEKEMKNQVVSTTRDRWALLEKKSASVRNENQLYNLLTDHENYPKSICSHFENIPGDPSSTCGGLVGNLKTGSWKIWRGCPLEDSHYRELKIKL